MTAKQPDSGMTSLGDIMAADPELAPEMVQKLEDETRGDLADLRKSLNIKMPEKVLQDFIEENTIDKGMQTERVDWWAVASLVLLSNKEGFENIGQLIQDIRKYNLDHPGQLLLPEQEQKLIAVMRESDLIKAMAKEEDPDDCTCEVSKEMLASGMEFIYLFRSGVLTRRQIMALIDAVLADVDMDPASKRGSEEHAQKLRANLLIPRMLVEAGIIEPTAVSVLVWGADKDNYDSESSPTYAGIYDDILDNEDRAGDTDLADWLTALEEAVPPHLAEPGSPFAQFRKAAEEQAKEGNIELTNTLTNKRGLEGSLMVGVGITNLALNSLMFLFNTIDNLKSGAGLGDPRYLFAGLLSGSLIPAGFEVLGKGKNGFPREVLTQWINKRELAAETQNKLRDDIFSTMYGAGYGEGVNYYNSLTSDATIYAVKDLIADKSSGNKQAAEQEFEKYRKRPGLLLNALKLRVGEWAEQGNGGAYQVEANRQVQMLTRLHNADRERFRETMLKMGVAFQAFDVKDHSDLLNRFDYTPRHVQATKRRSLDIVNSDTES